MKRSLFMSLVVAALAFALALPLYAAAPKAPADGLTMKLPEGKKATKGMVKFNHSKHADSKCVDCHHKKDAKGNEYVACDSKGCHENFEAKQGKDSFYASYHVGAKSCVGCHKAKKEAKPNAPTACDKCHPKA